MGTQLYRSEGPACMADGGMIIGGCPTAPGRNIIQTSFNISQSAPFAELLITMQIIGSNNQSIVCVAVLLEQNMAEVSTAISYLPLVLAVLSGSISLAATVMRASVGNGFLGAVASYGLPTEAISVHTPGFFDIIFYTQFMMMTGMLSINYPSFYSTFTSLFHWSFLEFGDTLTGKGPANATDVLKYGGSGSVNQIKSSVPNGSWSNNNNSQSSAYLDDVQKRHFLQDESYKHLLYVSSISAIGSTHATAVLRHAETRPAILSRTNHWEKRQAGSGPTGMTGSPVDPSPSPSDPPTQPTSPPTSDPTSPPTKPPTSPPVSTLSDSGSSTSSRSRTSVVVRPTSIATRTTPSRPPTSSTSPTLVIPTITDPFTNKSGGSVQHNVSRFGIESYAAAIGAFPTALFLGTLINVALAAVASLAISAVFLGVAWIMAKENHQRGKTLHHALNFVAGNLLRVWSLLYTPMALSALYQLTISGGVGRTVAAAASLLIISVGATIFFTWRILRASSELLLYDDQATLLKYGTLYNTLAPEGTLVFLMVLLVRFLWGLAISMLSSFGIAQVAVLIVVEFAFVVILGVKWPFAQSGDNKFHLFLGIIRIVITGCSISYIHELQASPDLRQLFAYIQMALHLAVFIVIFALALWNFIQVCMFWRLRHSDAWRGPTKSYNLEDPADENWGLRRPSPGEHTGGNAINRHSDQEDGGGEEGNEFRRTKNRRFTVMSYSSLESGSLDRPGRGSIQHVLHPPSPTHITRRRDSSDDDTLRYGSPAEKYRQARLMDHGRSRLVQDASASEVGTVADEAMMNGRLDSLIPLTGSAVVALGTAAAVARSGTGSSGSRSHSRGAGSSELDGSPKLNNTGRQSTPTGGIYGNLPQRGSYANFQRMSHQGTPDLRTRRMSDITRDGPYLYDVRKEEPDNGARHAAAIVAASHEPRQSVWASLKSSMGKAFQFGKRSSNSPTGDNSKPKAFEVMRPSRRNFAPEEPLSSGPVDETGSQAGGDQLRELNSIGISRFFQESDRGYEKNRSLFVANPSAMISRTGSLISTVSGAMGPQGLSAHGRLDRTGSGTAESIRTLSNVRSKGTGVGSGLGLAGGAGTGSGSGSGVMSVAGDKSSMAANSVGIIDASVSEHSGTGSTSDRDSRRTSAAMTTGAGSGGQLYPPRHSAESSSNIADALAIEVPLMLQGGGILRVSKGPEKAVQYWHHKKNQYVESIAESLQDEKEEEQGVKKRGSGDGSSVSPAPPATPVLLLPLIQTNVPQAQAQAQTLPTQARQQLQRQQQSPSSPSTKSRSMTGSSIGGGGSGGPESAPESPTESQESPTAANVAASAGRMHEILGRMFSDRSVRLHGDQDQDSDSMSISSQDTSSTFSGHMNAGQRSILQQTQPFQTTNGAQRVGTGDEQQRLDEDTQSIEKYDMLEPVPEDSDLESEMDSEVTPRQAYAGALDSNRTSFSAFESTSGTDDGSTAPSSATSRLDLLKRASSTANERHHSGATSLMRTFSGPTSSGVGALGVGVRRPGLLKPKQSSLSSRPLAQSPLHSPSVQLGSGSHPISAVTGGYPPYGAGAGGLNDLSRHSSTLSASSKMEYLDATWLDPLRQGNNALEEQQSSFLNRNTSVGTVRTEASYVTAMSQYPSDDEDYEGL
ncbi:hypothetical protein BGZ99_003749 [Dissophora globulifera]|uniref:TRP C-terminal domain-containing protein n=1 Tax=Dissophora globulifera TaxID=979702 RepID=A0A9P6RKF4_9FUNG|nr:hypothetical protein BGZ99_003749 [Dissophora globulifera]